MSPAPASPNVLTPQGDKRWLATHLFHAKRFHMANLWGYRLPLSPTLKSFRASYRAARRKAILSDTSYFGVIEVEGQREELLAVLGGLTAGGTFAGGKYESGHRSAHIDVYHPDGFPHKLIGPAEVIWRAPEASSTSRRLWLRVHPSIFEDRKSVV